MGITRLDRINLVNVVLIPKRIYGGFSPSVASYSFIKIAFKLLVNRLGSMFQDLIGTNRSNLLRVENILDGIIAAHEIIHQVKKESKEGILCRLDFDRVNWYSLLGMLSVRDFGPKWNLQIRNQLLPAKTQILVIKIVRKEIKYMIGFR